MSARCPDPAPLDLATAAVLLTLVDNETPLWLDAAATPARDWLAFHCGAAIIAAPEKAAFAVALSMPDPNFFAIVAKPDNVPIVALVFLLAATTGFAQGFGRLSGTVADPTGPARHLRGTPFDQSIAQNLARPVR